MGVAVAGGRGVLQNVTPFSAEDGHIHTTLFCSFNVCLPPRTEPQHDPRGADAAPLQVHSVEGPHVDVDPTLLYN